VHTPLLAARTVSTTLGVYPPGASLCRRVTCCTAVVYTALIEADKVEHASLFALCATVYSLPLVLLVLVGLLQLLCPLATWGHRCVDNTALLYIYTPHCNLVTLPKVV
jgi:hypothetical protein